MRRLYAAAAAALIAVLLVSCGSSTPTGPSNDGTTGLTFDSGQLGTGNSFAHKFGTKGAVTYYCTVHPGCTNLMGTVTVVDSTVIIPGIEHTLAITIDDGGPGCGYLLSASSTTVHPGETIQWINRSQDVHTVTSR